MSVIVQTNDTPLTTRYCVGDQAPISGTNQTAGPPKRPGDGTNPPGGDKTSSRSSLLANLLYLFLGLPLGILYLTVVLTVMSLSVGLMPLALLGIPTLISLWYITRALMSFERNLAITLLGAQIDPIPPVPKAAGGLWTKFKTIIADRYGWKGMLYLLLRFPAGLFTFTAAITLSALSLSLTLAPTYMWADNTPDNTLDWLGPWFDSYLWSFALVPIGIIITLATIHLTHKLADACRQWTTTSLN